MLSGNKFLPVLVPTCPLVYRMLSTSSPLIAFAVYEFSAAVAPEFGWDWLDLMSLPWEQYRCALSDGKVYESFFFHYDKTTLNAIHLPSPGY